MCDCKQAACHLHRDRFGQSDCPNPATGGIFYGTYKMCDLCRGIADIECVKTNGFPHRWLAIEPDAIIVQWRREHVDPLRSAQ